MRLLHPRGTATTNMKQAYIRDSLSSDLGKDKESFVFWASFLVSTQNSLGRKGEKEGEEEGRGKDIWKFLGYASWGCGLQTQHFLITLLHKGTGTLSEISVFQFSSLQK